MQLIPYARQQLLRASMSMPTNSFPTSLEEAVACDQADPLADVRSAFLVPDEVTYLVGHSLGPATNLSFAALRDTADIEWRTGLVGSWNSAEWIDMPSVLGRQIAKLIGVPSDDVVVCDSVSVNLFKLVGSLLRERGSDARIIIEAGEFPTDQYILERLAQQVGARFARVARGSGTSAMENGDILVRSLVDYRSAEVADVRQMEMDSERKGGTIVWDLSHATGVIDLRLADEGARFAVGCTYKYLNGGPGAPAFIYVRHDAIADLQTPLAGWLGHAEPFAFSETYEAAEGVQRFVAGTPPILSMAALKGALHAFDGLNLSDVEAKSQRLGDMCLSVFSRLGLQSPSPPIGQRRGGHVSLIHDHGYAVSRALAKRGIKTDFRTPDTIRFGLSPLFLSYSDVWRALEVLAEILQTNRYLDAEFSVRLKVT